MKFVIVIAIFAIACVAAFPSELASSIVAAVERTTPGESNANSTNTIRPFPQEFHVRPPPVQHAFIAAAGAFITKIFKHLPK